MRVQVQAEMDEFGPDHLHYKRFDSKDLRIFLLGGRSVEPVEVAAEAVAAEVAVHDAVGIDHRHDVKDALLQQELSLCCFREEVFDEAV